MAVEIDAFLMISCLCQQRRYIRVLLVFLEILLHKPVCLRFDIDHARNLPGHVEDMLQKAQAEHFGDHLQFPVCERMHLLIGFEHADDVVFVQIIA